MMLVLLRHGVREGRGEKIIAASILTQPPAAPLDVVGESDHKLRVDCCYPLEDKLPSLRRSMHRFGPSPRELHHALVPFRLLDLVHHVVAQLIPPFEPRRFNFFRPLVLSHRLLHSTEQDLTHHREMLAASAVLDMRECEELELLFSACVVVLERNEGGHERHKLDAEHRLGFEEEGLHIGGELEKSAVKQVSELIVGHVVVGVVPYQADVAPDHGSFHKALLEALAQPGP
mmetsp:Transcript_22543/g.53274  ORF Transcript_22543/g.53274 Transcript_22543/m.53274 type:complete len:231 (+) Transcript_22543:61-753(+)